MVGLSWQVAQVVLSQGSQDPSLCVNSPIGHDVHFPVVLQVVQPSLQGIIQVVGEFLHVAHTVSSQAVQVPELS